MSKNTPEIQSDWILSATQICNIVTGIQEDFEKFPFKFPNEIIPVHGHFENGLFLHSNKYYFAKSYFDSSTNCENLALLLANKIRELDLKETTLIGFRGYMGLLLSKVKSILKETEWAIEFGVLEQVDNKVFTWQFSPDKERFKDNLVVVLPITCTCSTYIKLRKYLQNIVKDWRKQESKKESGLKKRKWKVKYTFINVFLIQDDRLKELKEPVYLIQDKAHLNGDKVDSLSKELTELYYNFNWKEIHQDRIVFKNNDDDASTYVAYPLIKLYSRLSHPDKCELCFPYLKDNDGQKSKLTDERNIFLTHDNFETPNLLLNFPKFGYTVKAGAELLRAHSLHLLNKDNLRFSELFYSDDKLKSSHLYGHYKVNNSSYLNYIRGNSFYSQNSDSILQFFDSVLREILAGSSFKKVIFITSRSKHSSTFLEEITTYSSKTGNNKNFAHGILPDKSYNYETHILRYDPQSEFIDNFMSSYKDLIVNKEDDSLIVFFEEVISGAKNFKLLSNYIKHYRVSEDKRHGFDYVFSLIDRAPFNTRQEILKKLESNKNKFSERAFISYFHLNVPVIEAAHLGNPLEDKVATLKQMIKDSRLDVLKLKICYELPSRQGKELPEENFHGESNEESLKYFPFEEHDRITAESLKLYKGILTTRKFDLLKLYASHEINTYLSDEKINKGNFDVETIIDSIWNKMKYSEMFFTSELHSPYRDKTIDTEKELLHDTILKILSRHPFTYYHKIDNSIFSYCLEKVEEELENIKRNGDEINFANLRILKFYIRRLMELDSSMLISKKLLNTLRSLYERGTDNANSLERLAGYFLDNLQKHTRSSGPANVQDEVTKSNLYYKIEQVNSFPGFLLYCYKETIFKNHYRSIKLEGLINSEDYLPKIITCDNCKGPDLIKLIQDPYYLLTGTIKAENIYLINELKLQHIEKLEKYFDALDKFKKENPDRISHEKFNDNLIGKWLDPFSPESILKFYFDSWKSDPIIINAQKFIDESRFNRKNVEEKESERFNQIKLAVSNMLKSVSLLRLRNKGKEFNVEIEEIIQTIVSILQPGIEKSNIVPGSKESKLGFALCIKYNSNSESEDSANNIFVISSDRASNGAKLSRDGLIHNLMDGIFAANPEYVNSMNFNERKKNIANEYLTEQSLLAAIKVNNEYHSFQDEYFVSTRSSNEVPDTIENLEQKSFSKLYQEDCLAGNGTGLPLLTDKNLSLFFRLSETENIISHSTDTKYYSKGKAVLIVTFNGVADLDNYRNFMSNEKVRLLLLIKEDLLNYLSDIFENTTFWDLVNSKKIIEFIDLMKHGINPFFEALRNFIEAKTSLSNDDKAALTQNELIFIGIVIKILETQFNTLLTKVDKDTTPLLDFEVNSYSQDKIEDLFRLIMQLPSITSFPIDDFELIISVDNFECANSIYFHVIPELFVNIRKHTFLIEGKKIYSIEFDGKSLIIKNPFDINLTPYPEETKEKGGRKVSQYICRELGIKFDYYADYDNSVYVVTLTFK